MYIGSLWIASAWCRRVQLRLWAAWSRVQLLKHPAGRVDLYRRHLAGEITQIATALAKAEKALGPRIVVGIEAKQCESAPGLLGGLDSKGK